MGGFFRFVEGVIIGGAVGTVAGLLLAPMAGEKLREDIKERLAYVVAEGQRAAAAKRAEMEREFADMRRNQVRIARGHSRGLKRGWRTFSGASRAASCGA